ncbi:MAG: hypothetical protein BWY06_02380 [Candidatus Latescibacteria bacterium ADurb.Bin168]|nr:MAG: hypothetical protein BWY06_02380 [Candidatus Latescibacteria bacterium ADurb.Bin168]
MTSSRVGMRRSRTSRRNTGATHSSNRHAPSPPGHTSRGGSMAYAVAPALAPRRNMMAYSAPGISMVPGKYVPGALYPASCQYHDWASTPQAFVAPEAHRPMAPVWLACFANSPFISCIGITLSRCSQIASNSASLSAEHPIARKLSR